MLKVAVVGGSIGGLSAATALHRLGCDVKVFERAATPFNGRGGSIGFCHVPLWERVAGLRLIRRGVPATRAQGAFLYGDLWRFWAERLPRDAVRYNATVTSLGDDPLRPTINGEQFDLAIIADGSWSSLRATYFTPALPQYAGMLLTRPVDSHRRFLTRLGRLQCVPLPRPQGALPVVQRGGHVRERTVFYNPDDDRR